MEVNPERLPHWSRVALAAPLARRAQPLFAEAWPDAAPDREAAVERAIAPAEQSAAERRASAGLRAADIEAIPAAGRALIPGHYPASLGADYAKNDPGPADPAAALVATSAAWAAEHGARGGGSHPEGVGRLARTAIGFAREAIAAADRPGLGEVPEADFEAAVGSAPQRPWWRFR